MEPPLVKAANGMFIGNTALFDLPLDTSRWEAEYQRTMDRKYAKNTRNFRPVKVNPKRDYGPDPPIFLVPRERGGPSYKEAQLEGADVNDVVYCPISKGFPMQDVSSFTLGPVVGVGLCIVNAAFSKAICIHHIEGGGVVDLKRKIFWRSSRNPKRRITNIGNGRMTVDGTEYVIEQWLRDNEREWLPEWEKWRRCLAMASIGNFHWTGDNEHPLTYRHQGRYLTFPQWKRECYIAPAYALIPQTRVFAYLLSLREQRCPLGLVHPKAREGGKEKAITRDFIRDMYTSPYEMVCMPYVVAGLLLGVSY